MSACHGTAILIMCSCSDQLRHTSALTSMWSQGDREIMGLGFALEWQPRCCINAPGFMVLMFTAPIGVSFLAGVNTVRRNNFMNLKKIACLDLCLLHAIDLYVSK